MGEVSALLPQPGGFEGFLHGVVLIEAHDLAVAQLVGVHELELGASAARAPDERR